MITAIQMEKPDDAGFTMTITLSLGEWKKIRAALRSTGLGGWAAEDLIDAICELVRRAEEKVEGNLKWARK